MASTTVDYLNASLPPELFPNPPIFNGKGTPKPGLLIQHHYQPEHITFEHSHQQHIVSIPVRGEWIERKVDGRTYREYPGQGDIGIYPAQQVHQIQWQGNAEFILLCLEPWIVTQAASQVGVDSNFELVPHLKVHDLLVYQIGLTLRAELEPGELEDPLYVESLVTTLLFHLLKHYSNSKQQLASADSGRLPQQQLQQVIDYVHEHLGSELAVSAIAQEISLSQYHFSRLFKQTTGMAPHQYVMQQRLERAKKLLRQSTRSLVDIAHECGFANQSHFAKTFRKLVGATPKAYRNGV
ncbi:helix-turn-helix transcriptional regulator [Oscillatoria sp. FACHB-1407]|uniref:AraC family transcriptional regulator n=1 Tax=Oscillatoria sp. FACHB-1407 TaxID=2692847 RepID=UPI001685178C|nr:AraC family transcriptional regulator [Oscillatoria sp. FACHB-1407]MBD2466056.1 helix-turn-helix transcriptional regulator [Oscillatoria sp. FACHB-1407]